MRHKALSLLLVGLLLVTGTSRGGGAGQGGR